MNEGAAPGIEAAPSYLLSENEAPGRYVPTWSSFCIWLGRYFQGVRRAKTYPDPGFRRIGRYENRIFPENIPTWSPFFGGGVGFALK